jgi:oligoendopeptidase F
MRNVITQALIWNANDFDDILSDLLLGDEITKETFFELMKMSNEDKVKQLESYIADNQDQIIELINDIITQGMMEDYVNNNQSINK